MKTKSGPTVSEVSQEFDRVLREWLTAAEYAEAVRMNQTEEYRDSCATHNFCDANMAMFEAMERCGIAADDITGDANLPLWNAAWNAWRDTYCGN